jgi:hypothetical protein
MPNPPEGGIINYYLKADAAGPVVLELFDAGGRLVRHYSSADPIVPLPDPKTNAPLPLHWYREPQGLSAKAGMHRFMWDVHYQPLAGGGGGRGGLPIAAVPFNTVPAPTTPWAPPGQYTVKLTVNGKTLSQPLTVTPDPRVKTPAPALRQVYTLSTAAYREAANAFAAAAQAQHLRDLLAEVQSGLKPPAAQAAAGAGDLAAAVTAFDKKVEAVIGVPGGGGRGAGVGGGAAPGAAPGQPTLSSAAAALSGVMNVLQSADVQPTAVQLRAIAAARAAGSAALAKWTALKAVDLPSLNAKLKAAGLKAIEIK